jgi:predicted short-subunit dehydrogenase-like oxidoreductase (DUF2520 family)
VYGPLDLAIVGAGRVGTALGVLLQRAGHRIVAVSGRHDTVARAERYLPGVPVLPARQAVVNAQLVLIAVPDDLIRQICSQVSTGMHRGQVVAHLSGSLGLDVLAPAAHWGIGSLALHPLQSVPDVPSGVKRIPGSGFAVTANNEAMLQLGERLAREAGGIPFRIRNEDKALYHAAAVFASNYLATVEAIAEHLFQRAGVEDTRTALAPLAIATLSNVVREGPSNALTGPVVRGDVGTLERNLEALKQAAPEAIAAYVALARAAAGLAEQDGRLSPQDRRAIEGVLYRWT